MGRPRKNPKTVTNACEFCEKEFEIGYQKRHQRFCGKVCANASPKTKQKIRDGQQKIYDEKFGGKHPMQTSETRKNFKSSMLDKYGVEHALQNEKFFEKMKSTNLKKYGTEFYTDVEKAKQTSLQRYGVDNIRKSDGYNIKYEKTCLEKYGVDHASKSSKYKHSHKLAMFEKFLTHPRFENFERLFEINEYKGVTPEFNEKYPFKCNRCSNHELQDISDGKWPKCSICDKKFSTFQTEIQDYISTLTPTPKIYNDRSIIYPYELDVYIPDHKIAIECDSLCYHSEVFGSKNKSYHLNKTHKCFVKELRLLHIWDSEWKSKQEIVKSILSNIFSKNQRVYARKCKVVELKRKPTVDFLNKNHIQGADKSTVKLGLLYDNEIVSVMTFCKSRFNKNFEWEIGRFCNKIGITITGGASKLFKYFVKNYNPKSIITYSDRRYFSGEIYLNLGFTFHDNTPPNYHYILNGYTATQNRVTWQKHKLKDKLLEFDNSSSEWENMKNHGFDRIWDCGHSKWIWKP